MEEKKGFMASLFDFSFRDFVTPRIIGMLYGVLLILTVIGAVLMIAMMFMIGPGYGVVTLLIIAPLYFFLSVLCYRVMLEVIVVIHRMKHDLADIHSTITKIENS
ncbi:MAG: DUF4282 domain-containing protein [Dehalococcoidia bacterium]